MSPWLIALIFSALPAGAVLAPLAVDECRLPRELCEAEQPDPMMVDALDVLGCSPALGTALLTTLRVAAPQDRDASVLAGMFPGAERVVETMTWDGDLDVVEERMLWLLRSLSDEAIMPTLRGLIHDVLRGTAALVAIIGTVHVPGVDGSDPRLASIVVRGVRAGITLVALGRGLPLPSNATDELLSAVRHEQTATAQAPIVARAARARGGLLTPSKFVY